MSAGYVADARRAPSASRSWRVSRHRIKVGRPALSQRAHHCALPRPMIRCTFRAANIAANDLLPESDLPPARRGLAGSAAGQRCQRIDGRRTFADGGTSVGPCLLPDAARFVRCRGAGEDAAELSGLESVAQCRAAAEALGGGRRSRREPAGRALSAGLRKFASAAASAVLCRPRPRRSHRRVAASRWRPRAGAMARTRDDCAPEPFFFKDHGELAAKVLWAVRGDVRKALTVLLETARTRKGAHALHRPEAPRPSARRRPSAQSAQSPDTIAAVRLEHHRACGAASAVRRPARAPRGAVPRAAAAARATTPRGGRAQQARSWQCWPWVSAAFNAVSAYAD